MMLWRAMIVWLLLALPAAAQPQPSGPQVLIIDSERLFFETEYGRRISADLAEKTAALQSENDAIVAQLTEEERSLTQRRATMDADVFRDEAAAFDIRVQEVRRDREAKTVELQAEATRARAAFEERVQAIVANIMIERGAAMVLEQRNVILSVRAANITDDAVARIDAELGDGAE
ncbi:MULTISPECIES: OmpH family outer membrane protein [unclassified Yoonia]|uniref:OmpH family outer membrane protein n=1 Tax=unclassified Yoonia TaxID=2629118 RepID=UPI002AFFA98D|nr:MULTISPECIES: OmpH family outer membrane protein [unclassified Yoonia]